MCLRACSCMLLHFEAFQLPQKQTRTKKEGGELNIPLAFVSLEMLST